MGEHGEGLGEHGEIIPPPEHTQQLEEDLLQALLEKGPALFMELAARTLSFPDDISVPLRELEQQGYIARQRLRKGEMYVLTEQGYLFVQRDRGKE
jgi:DNA-binding MarR family transcriptional regulator